MAEEKTHWLQLKERNTLEMAGVSHVDSFDDDTIVLATQMGTLTIKGHNLRIQHLDLDQGQFIAQGEFDGMVYSQSPAGKGKGKGKKGGDNSWQRMWR